MATTFSLYEQQAIESRPCPRCEAYTLCYHEPRDISRVAHRGKGHGLRRSRSLVQGLALR